MLIGITKKIPLLFGLLAGGLLACDEGEADYIEDAAGEDLKDAENNEGGDEAVNPGTHLPDANNDSLSNGPHSTHGGERILISSSYDYLTGRIQTAIWARSVYGQHNQVDVAVDPDFVLIGGGARVTNASDSSDGVNALLTASYPKDDGTFSTFVAESKDHLSPYPHKLWVYAIGMKLHDFSKVPLDPYGVKLHMKITKTLSTLAQHPSSTTCGGNDGYQRLSGGARVIWQNPGNLLTQSAPPNFGNGPCWMAKSKDHEKASLARIESYSIWIKPEIDQYGTLVISSKWASKGTSSGQRGNVLLNSKDSQIPWDPWHDWQIAGVGGMSTFNGNGRMLFEMYPTTTQTAVVGDKDHLKANGGILYGYVTMIRSF